MALTRQQKKYIKKNISRFSSARVAADLDIQEKEVLKYLKKIWKEKKYQRLIKRQALQGSIQDLPQRFTLKTWLKQNLTILTLLTLLVLFSYLNSLGNNFVSDDIPGIVQKENLGSLSYIFSKPLIFPGRRIVYFLAFNIAGKSPAVFRAFNILAHLGNTWVIFLLISLISKRKLATLTAAIFAVHPILVESITWITAGSYAMYSFFLLLSLLTYFLAEGNKKLYFFSLAAFVIALSFSVGALVFPLILLIFEVSRGSLRKNWKKTLPFWSIIGVASLPFLFAFGERVEILQTEYYLEKGINNPLFQIPYAVTSYLELIFWPKNLTLYHSELAISAFEYFVRLSIFIFFLGMIYYAYKRNRFVFFWLSFFIITLFTTLTPFGVSWIVAERYVYLGSLGIFVIAGLGFQKLSEIKNWEKASYILLSLIVIFLSIRTIKRNMDWKNEDSLWIATAKTSPSSPKNHNNLGDLYARRGDLESAVKEFKKAIEIKPNYADAYHNLANTYQKMGEIEKAIENYKYALNFNPKLWQSYQNLASIYFNQGNFDQAEENLQKATNINPQNANLYLNLGIIYLKTNNLAKAEESFLQALKFDPQNQFAQQVLIQLRAGTTPDIQE